MITKNIAKVKERIRSACANLGILPETITIVAVSKNRSVPGIREVIDCGITDIGENRIQEALLKFSEIANQQIKGPAVQRIKWHFVGHLQTNKVKDAVRIFDLIQSVDSLHLAEEINKQAAKINKVQDILIEVKTSPEATKFGIAPGEATNLARDVATLKNVSLKGLMTIAPIADDPEKSRPYFSQLRELRDELNAIRDTQYAIRILSMGMTDDFEIAIEEGSNMVRIGRAIFGE